MPTFADAEAAIAARDYRAALSILEALDVVGEDACYRRDIQAAACADRLGLFPLCEEYATRAHFYGDDMADPFALMARAQRRQGLIADSAATASSGARIHPTNPAIARELALALVALGRYEEARDPADLATDTYKKDVELLMAYGHVWEPVNPDAAQWAFHHAKKVNLDNDDARIAFDSLAHPLKGAGRSSYRIEIQPPVAAAYRADSRGGCNTCYALSSSSSRCLGVSQFSVLRGRSPRWSAMASRSASVRSDRSVPLGMYWRNSPFVFSLVPRCQGECGSQKYTSRPSSEAILRCWASSLPWSQVSDRRKEWGTSASLSMMAS